MIKLNQKINSSLAILLIAMIGLVCAFLILTSLNQPSGIQIDSRAASIKY